MGSSCWNSKKNDSVKEFIKNPSRFYEGNSNINRRHIQGLIDEYYTHKLKQRKSANNEANCSSEVRANSKLDHITYEDLYIGSNFMFKELYVKDGGKSKNISKLWSRRK